MRHRKKRHHLSRPADQRKALLRTLATAFIKEGKIVTTLARARAVLPVAEKLITLSRKGGVQNIRTAARYVYNDKTDVMTEKSNGKLLVQTVLRRLFQEIGPKLPTRQGGYVRLVQVPPRRGDAAPMALLTLITEETTPKTKIMKPAKSAKKATAPKAEAAPVAAEGTQAHEAEPIPTVTAETPGEGTDACAVPTEETPASEEA